MEILAGTNRLDLARKKDRTYTFATQFLFNQPESDVKKIISIKNTTGILQFVFYFTFPAQIQKESRIFAEILQIIEFAL